MNAIKPLRKQDIITKVVGNETILYSSGKRVIHVLNHTAKLVWELCDGSHSIEDMERAMRAKFSFSAECDVEKDVREMLDDFAKTGVLEEKNAQNKEV